MLNSDGLRRLGGFMVLRVSFSRDFFAILLFTIII